VILDRDLSGPPRADKDELNKPCILEAPFTGMQIYNVKDPEWFIGARIKHQFPPTKAYWKNELGWPRESPINERHLSLKSQADFVSGTLSTLFSGERGCDFRIRESSQSNAFSVVVWPQDEQRRFWYAGPLNVGLVIAAFASHPKERVLAGLAAEKPSICPGE